jgi:hypothetical protein
VYRFSAVVPLCQAAVPCAGFIVPIPLLNAGVRQCPHLAPSTLTGFPITQMLFADFGRGVEDVVYSTTFKISYLERQLNGSLVDATSAHLSAINVP